MKYYSDLKRKGILIHATPWLNLEDTMLSEINQSRKDSAVWFTYMKYSRVVKVTETESR